MFRKLPNKSKKNRIEGIYTDDMHAWSLLQYKAKKLFSWKFCIQVPRVGTHYA